MQVTNEVVPNEEQIKGFFEPGPDGPIYMVNLLKFKAQADYADGRETHLTGREAYQIYEQGVSLLLPQYGGSAGYFAAVERLMLGQVEELWDMVGIVVYPSRQAMLEMLQCDAMKEISVHRSAGLAGQLNIETVGARGDWIAAARE